MATGIATCHTSGCGNAGIGIEVPTTLEVDGESYPIGSHACGVCGQPITDVVESNQTSGEEEPS